MNVLTLVDPKIMGEKHPTYGYSVWSETDSDLPVMFNVMDEKNLIPQVRVTYEAAEHKTSSKGREYMRLKKVKFEDDPVAKEDVVPFVDKPAPTFNKENKAFLKDLSDYPVRVFNGSLHYAKDAGLNLIGDADDRRAYLEYVQDVTNELLTWSDNIRKSEAKSEAKPEPKPEIKEAPKSLRGAWDNHKQEAVSWNEPELTDRDFPGGV
jgi:hypothetical protein